MQSEGSNGHGGGACPFFPSLAAYLVLLSSIQVSVLASSLASLRLTRPAAAVILVASLAAAWRVRRRLGADQATTSLWVTITESTRGRRTTAAFLAFYVFLFVCAVIVADPSWDGNTYHLPTIQLWYQQGRVAWIEGVQESTALPYINGYPKAAEIVSFFLCTLLGPALSNTLNLVYLPLGVLGIGSIALALGASRRAALLAGAALLLVPFHLGQSLTTYVDSAFGSSVIAWIAVVVRLRQLDRNRWGLEGLVLGCALGQVIGTKGIGPVPGALGALALVGVHLARRSLSLPALLAWWLSVAVCALAVGGFSYARDIVYRRNPLYPMALTIAGYAIFPGLLDPYNLPGTYAVDGMIEHWPVPAQVAFTWLQGIWNWPRSIVGFDSRLGGLGFLWALGCLPAVYALVRSRLRTRGPWRDDLVEQPLWLVLAVVSASLVLLPFPWWARHTVWIYALGLPCLAVVLEWPLGKWGRRWRLALVVVAVVEAGIALSRWQVPLLDFAIRTDLGGTPGPVRYPTHFFPPWTLRGKIFERLLQPDETIGVGSVLWYQEPLVGLLSEPVGARRIEYLPENLETDFPAWYERVHPRWLMLAKRDLPEPIAALHPEVYNWGELMVLEFR